MLSCDVKRIVAVALVLTTTFITMPLSAADFSTTRPVIGSISAVGSVDLRGVGISQEGTLFAGDRILAHEKGYAKVLLGTGSKIELSAQTDVSVNRDAQGVKIAMNTGTVGFTAHTPLRIDVLPFEVTATDDSSGNVAIMSPTTAGIRAINGKVTVRNLKTSESFVVLKGQERLLGLSDGVHAPSLAEVASNMPMPIPAPKPAPAPQTPAGKTSGGLAMDEGAWLAVIGGAAVAGVAIWGLVVAKNNESNTDSLKAQLAANQASNALALKNVANASAIANAAAQQQAAMASVSALAGQTQLALNAAGQGSGANAATAASLVTQANANASQLTALLGQIQAAQVQLAAGGGSAAQVQSLLSTEESLRSTTNNLINQLNALLNATSNVPGVPKTSVAAIGAPAQASASIPT